MHYLPQGRNLIKQHTLELDQGLPHRLQCCPQGISLVNCMALPHAYFHSPWCCMLQAANLKVGIWERVQRFL